MGWQLLVGTVVTFWYQWQGKFTALLIKCANVFWKWVQRSAYPAKVAREHLRDLGGLGLTAIPVQILADDALDIALKHRVTAYDACYIAAAAQLRLPLITADEKLARQVSINACMTCGG